MVVREPQRGKFNLGSRRGMSKADFAFELAAALQLPTWNMQAVPHNPAVYLARRPTDMRMDCTRFENAYRCVLPSLHDEIFRMKELYDAFA